MVRHLNYSGPFLRYPFVVSAPPASEKSGRCLKRVWEPAHQCPLGPLLPPLPVHNFRLPCASITNSGVFKFFPCCWCLKTMGANKGQKDCPLGGPLKNHSFLLFCIKFPGSFITACCGSAVTWEASHPTQSSPEGSRSEVLNPDCTFGIPPRL